MDGQTGHIRIGGVCLEFVRFGGSAQDAPAVVLLHEGLGCVAMWRDFPRQLNQATGLEVTAYSRQGYGGSDPVDLPRPLSYMHDEARDILPPLLARTAPQGSILVGHSDGASIAAIYAGTSRDPGLKGCVLMAPHFFTETMGLDSICEARNAFDTGDLRARLERYHGDNVDCAFRGWNDAWLDPDFVNWSLLPELENVTVPMLVIQGEDDAYGTLRQVEVTEERSRGSVQTLVLPECGHAPFKDRPDETLAAISDFVDGLLE